MCTPGHWYEIKNDLVEIVGLTSNSKIIREFPGQKWSSYNNLPLKFSYCIIPSFLLSFRSTL